MASDGPLDKANADNKQTGLSAGSCELSKKSKLKWRDNADEDWAIYDRSIAFVSSFLSANENKYRAKWLPLEIYKLKLRLLGILNFLILMAPNNLLKYCPLVLQLVFSSIRLISSLGDWLLRSILVLILCPFLYSFLANLVFSACPNHMDSPMSKRDSASFRSLTWAFQ